VVVQERQEKDSRVKIRMYQVHIDKLHREFIHKGSQGHTNKPKYQVLTERKLDETSAMHKYTPQKSCKHLKQETRISNSSAQTATKVLTLIICTQQ
jgi:hypothetical protein